MLNRVFKNKSFNEHFFRLSDAMGSFDSLGLDVRPIDWVHNEHNARRIQIQPQSTTRDVDEQDTNVRILVEQAYVLRS